MNIKVLGSGCAKCKQLEANVRKAVEEAALDATVEKVSDIAQIMNYGVMMTPALVVDEVVKSVGKVLSPKEIRAMLGK
jgi:small redox-active disulfide protein 2